VASVLLRPSPEAIVSNRTLGILATILGSALGAWWVTTQRRSAAMSRQSSRDHGVVIFDNTPTAADVEGIL
jgi:hypothetical protein